MDQPIGPESIIPWGYFPAEQYLIRYWDWSSPLSTDEQRQELVRAFIQLDSIPIEWDALRCRDAISREPTAEEVREILEPWRPQWLRTRAHPIWRCAGHSDGCSVVLRTYYGGGSDDDRRMAEWVQEDEEYDESLDPDDRWWRVLDDPTLFNVGSEFGEVYDILPELVGRSRSMRPVTKGLNPGDLEEARTYETEEARIDSIQFLSCAEYEPLLLVDQQAFETDMWTVLLLDGKGNLVRYYLVPSKDLWVTRLHANQGFSGYTAWQRAEIGDKYQEWGEIGKNLYPLVKDYLDTASVAAGHRQ